ncbi:ATP-binding protein [Staphylococcus caledonicus]|uniref:ATP-binding protein n=1 Tax=Staphylococcus caledonicus TaxID=2741333 RepID=UPI0018E48EC1|nr:ATP-binding protein [Staphylococcus caledonicus]MBI5973418.1 ATP-binding protein [Staphylococcus caledonicus]
MKNITEINLNTKLRSGIVDKQLDLKCEKCGNRYDYYKFDNGQEERIGCDCYMIDKAKESTHNYKAKQKRLSIENVFNQSMTNDDLLNAKFDNYKPTNNNLLEAKQIIQRYTANFNLDNPRSLLLEGSFGIGKSHLAMSVVREVKKKGFTALFIDVSELVTAYRDTYNKQSNITEKELDKLIKEVDLLVIDDYGTSLTQYGISKMFTVANLRTGKHNIITTNNKASELATTKDMAKIFSRLMKNTKVIKMHGADYRLKDFKA